MCCFKIETMDKLDRVEYSYIINRNKEIHILSEIV